MKEIKAEIINIGDELLIGQVVNTNASWLGEWLTFKGFRVNGIRAVADVATDILKVIQDSSEQNDLVLISGGLGPTSDDITRNVLADWWGKPLEIHPEVLRRNEERMKRLGIVMNELNRNQALVPQGAVVIRNDQGTAPGILMQKNNCVVVALPGVPFEMKSIVEDHLWKVLSDLFEVQEVLYRVVMTAGEAESVLAGKISEWESAWRQKGISLAYLPQPGMVRLRLTDKGAGAEGIEQAVQELKLILPKEIFSTEGESLAEVTGRMLLEKKYTLAVAESCTGGRISSLITQVPGASEWFRGGVVAYSNDLKQQFAGVTADTLNRYGAVSQETVREMAEGIRQSTGATIGLSVSGIAGPGGGTDAKPVGTVWIGISGPNGSFQKVFHFGNMREINIARASMVALNTVRLHLLV